MIEKRERPVCSELYTAEAAESRRKAQGEVAVPDPDAEAAARAIEENSCDE
jgi:hypothetical protein